MNIHLGNQGHPQGFQPMIIGQASPYLSPFNCSLSIADQNSPDDLQNFHLEQQPFDTIQGEMVYKEQSYNPELFLSLKESNSEAKDTFYLQLHQQCYMNNEYNVNIEKEQENKKQKQEIETPASIIKQNNSKIYSIIEFLVMNDSQEESQLLVIGKPLYQGQKNLEFVFKTLLTKFKKLRKTKQQMVKYCMRKAFKYTNDQSKHHKSPKPTKPTSSPSSPSPHSHHPHPPIQLPFRKNSSQKTMNIHFLKQTFSNKQFVNNYNKFLLIINKIIEDDNKSKIIYLTQSIQKMLNNDQIKNICNIKRLPWTMSILRRTEELARSLLEFVDGRYQYGQYGQQYGQYGGNFQGLGQERHSDSN